MSSATAELQKAIFARLADDSALATVLGGVRIHDHAPANMAFPHVTFGRTSVYDWSTSTESGAEQLLTLHVWSKAKGKKETLEALAAIEAALAPADLGLDGFRLVNLRLEFQDIRYDEDIAVHHGLLRYRAVTEPA